MTNASDRETRHQWLQQHIGEYAERNRGHYGPARENLGADRGQPADGAGEPSDGYWHPDEQAPAETREHAEAHLNGHQVGFVETLGDDTGWGGSGLSLAEAAHSIVVRAVMAYWHDRNVNFTVNCIGLAIAVFLALI
jgi:hypothetical protein